LITKKCNSISSFIDLLIEYIAIGKTYW